MTDPADFIATYKRFLDEIVEQFEPAGQSPSPFCLAISGHLGRDARELAVVAESLSPARLPDADLALAALAERGGAHRTVGASGGPARAQSSFAELLRDEAGSLAIGPVDYVSLAIGPDSERQVVAFGVHLLTYSETPVAILQRQANLEWDRAHATLEVLCSDADVASRLLREVRRLVVEHSVLRGQVISFTENEYQSSLGGVTFHARPRVPATDVILPEGTLDRLNRHAVLLGQHRDRMLAAGQHLKRGILLYGPPGTGKTLTVRHLLGRTEGTTAVLLAGSSLGLIGEATTIARAMQPAIVVLEDCDLVAEDRDIGDGPDSMLFDVLEALDGLDEDADVTFLLTTNRADLLERALTQRPGRVDLAIEIPLPDLAARRALFALYGRDLPFTAEALDAAAAQAEGVTASFAKELIRRAVLVAAIADRDPHDADLQAALDELLSDREAFTRSLLASGPAQFNEGPYFDDAEDEDLRDG